MKMKRGGWLTGMLAAAIILILGACGGGGAENNAVSAGGSSTPASASAESVVVEVEASDFEWKLSQTEFKAGQAVEFRLTGKEGRHGFSIVGTDISQPLKVDETGVVTWTPGEAGEYTIKCNVLCGDGHRGMETNITVA